jgi:hypothetical protein
MTDTTSSWVGLGASLRSWPDLAGIANTWIFRGVDNAQHKLIPAIGRPGARKDMDTGADPSRITVQRGLVTIHGTPTNHGNHPN